MEPNSAEPKEGSNFQDREDASKSNARLQMFGSIFVVVLGVVFWLAGGNFAENLGADFVAAGIIGFLVFVLYGKLSRDSRERHAVERTELLEEIAASCHRIEGLARIEEERIQEAIANGVPETLSAYQVAREVGLAGFDETRPRRLGQGVLEAERTVDIIEVSLKTMRSLETADWLKCKAKVRIILLDPTHPEKQQPLSVQRDLEEGQKKGQILDEINEIIYRLPDEWLYRGNGEAPAEDDEEGRRVKLARVMPTLSYFRIDNVAYFAPLIHKRVGDQTMHLRFGRGGKFFDELNDHFEKLWNDDTRVDFVPQDRFPATF